MWLKLKNGTYVNTETGGSFNISHTDNSIVGRRVTWFILFNMSGFGRGLTVMDEFATKEDAQEVLDEFMTELDYKEIQPPVSEEETRTVAEEKEANK